MSNYDPDALVADFARRTRRNLELIRRFQREYPEGEAFEVTQLINSSLGLLVFPTASYLKNIPQTPLAELREQGWPIPNVQPGYKQVKTLRDLVRYLRNAIAHFNVEFLADENNQIRGLIVWNVRPNGTIDWKAEISIEELEGISQRFIQLLTNLEAPKKQEKRSVVRQMLPPRSGWEEAFRAMSKEGGDQLLDEPVITNWDRTEWEW